MKQYKKIVPVLIWISMFALPALADSSSLQEGFYQESTDTGCAAQVFVDSSSGDITVASEGTALQPCDSPGTSAVFSRQTGNRFVGQLKSVETAQDVSDCAPTPSSPTPCTATVDGQDISLYDSQTGAFIMQAGDISSVEQTLTVLSPASFEISPVQWAFLRGSTVLKQGQVGEAHTFSKTQ